MACNLSDREKRIAKEVTDWLFTIALALFIAFLITHILIINAVVPSESMENTIMIGDRLITNRLAYVFNDIERGDIIVFPAPDGQDVLYVKRVIGLPGETIDIIDGLVYIDGVLLVEDYVSSEIIDGTKNSSYEVPEGTVFCLGDNRQHSNDARYWENTFLDIDDVLGKVVFRYYPRFKMLG